jgi:hypothetical protein
MIIFYVNSIQSRFKHVLFQEYALAIGNLPHKTPRNAATAEHHVAKRQQKDRRICAVSAEKRW